MPHSADVPLVIGDRHMERLEDMAAAQSTRAPALSAALLAKLARAQILPQDQVPADVVRIGSHICYSDPSKSTPQTLCLVWPEEADIAQTKLSVLTPFGIALIGLKSGDGFLYATDNRKGRQVSILDVT